MKPEDQARQAAPIPDQNAPLRDILFVSHANPEDNEFTLWLALRLAAEGYHVWSDLTKLLGGERFWKDVEAAIRQHTVKFLFVLSRTSNSKESPLDELTLALGVQRDQQLKDFVIPLWIDDLPARGFNVQLVNINAIPFQHGWADGLGQLLEKLQRDDVPKDPLSGTGVVRSWWQTYRSASAGVRQKPEWLISNWYPVELPQLYFHDLHREGIGPITLPDDLPYPGVHYNQYLVSFAPAQDFDKHLGPLRIDDSMCLDLASDTGSAKRLWSFADERTTVTKLLNQAWKHMIASRNLSTYEFANQPPAFYFKGGMTPKNLVHWVSPNKDKHRRNVIGVSKRGIKSDGNPRLWHWHFSLSARAVTTPRMGYLVRPHVLFSDDGVSIWDNDSRLHRARRSFCKNWWNDRWRDLIGGTVAWLAQGGDRVKLGVGKNTFIRVPTTPILLQSTISYDEKELDSIDEADEIIFGVEEEDEDEENIAMLNDAPPLSR